MQMHQMGDAGNALPLLGGGGGHQSPGGAEKDVPQLPALHAAEKVAAQHRGRAAAARAPGVDVLALAVVEEQAAVLVDGAHVHMVVLQALVQQLGAHRTQIPGEDAVVVPGGGAGILEELVQAGGRRGGHGRPHVGGVLYAQILDGARQAPGHPDLPAQAHQRAARRGGGPLGGGGALPAVLQRQAELALCRAEVGACHRQGLFRGAALHQNGGQQQRLGHGGAGPVLPQEGDAEIQQPKGGGDALVEQIPRQNEVHLLGGEAGLFQCQGDGLLLEAGLGLFPAALLEGGVPKGLVEIAAQGTLGLPLAPHCSVGEDGGAVKLQGALAQPPHREPPSHCHTNSTSPYTTDAVMPYTSTGPAMEKSLAPRPLTKPSACVK